LILLALLISTFLRDLPLEAGALANHPCRQYRHKVISLTQLVLYGWKHSSVLILINSTMNTRMMNIDRLHERRAKNFADVRAGIDVEPKCLEAREDLMSSSAEIRQRESQTSSKTIPSADFKPPDEKIKT
jgi:hypothetical protein